MALTVVLVWKYNVFLVTFLVIINSYLKAVASNRFKRMVHNVSIVSVVPSDSEVWTPTEEQKATFFFPV